jgi:hypothetical protein
VQLWDFPRLRASRDCARGAEDEHWGSSTRPSRPWPSAPAASRWPAARATPTPMTTGCATRAPARRSGRWAGSSSRGTRWATPSRRWGSARRRSRPTGGFCSRAATRTSSGGGTWRRARRWRNWWGTGRR